MSLTSKRNYSIDVLKAFCSFLVIVIHVGWTFKQEVLPFARCAVPCFFMISGYFLYNDGGIGLNKIRRSLKHILNITLWATIVYVVYSESKTLINDGSVFVPTSRNLIAWVFFNSCSFGYHLWYLYAYIYVLLIIWLIEKYSNWRVLFWTLPILLLINVIFYILPFYGIELPIPAYRNFLFTGLPFFTLGALIKKLKNKLTLKKLIVGLACILFALTTVGESMLLTYFGKNPGSDILLSTPFLASCIFMLSISIKETKPTFLSKIGKDDSLDIYIYHPIFIPAVFGISEILGVVDILYWITPFAVFAFTLVFIYLVRFLKKIPERVYNFKQL